MGNFDNYGKICANCGGEYAIHHSKTLRCPKNGKEAPIDKKQEWMESTFSEEIKEQLTFNLQARNGNYYCGNKPKPYVGNCWCNNRSQALVFTLEEARNMLNRWPGCNIVIATTNKGPNDVKKYFEYKVG